MQLEKTKRERGNCTRSTARAGVWPLPPGSQLAASSKPYFSPSLLYLLVLERRKSPPPLTPPAGNCLQLPSCQARRGRGPIWHLLPNEPARAKMWL